jgi:hypothetical protein
VRSRHDFVRIACTLLAVTAQNCPGRYLSIPRALYLVPSMNVTQTRRAQVDSTSRTVIDGKAKINHLRDTAQDLCLFSIFRMNRLRRFQTMLTG